ncbi:SDR family oxidoreductase, partial [Sphingobium sp. 3R8]|nr:SDR family oxidoreductase [Sphingobium sp. 3R8]
AKLLEDPELTRYYASQAALNRIGKPDDIAAVVTFLASDDGRWVTGQVLEASGGMHL